MKKPHQAWTFEKIEYWTHDIDASYAQNKPVNWILPTQSTDITLLVEGNLLEKWSSFRHESIGLCAFSNELTRWERLNNMCKTKLSTRLYLNAMMECARYDPVKTWSIALQHPHISEDAIINELHKNIDPATGSNVAYFHPGTHALLATSSKPGHIERILYDMLEIANPKEPRHVFVHILHTTREIYHEYNKGELFEKILNATTEKMLERPGWNFRWLFYGDRIFEDFPNKDFIKETLLQQQPHIEKPTRNFTGYREILRYPRQLEKTLENAWIYEHPDFETHLQRWSEFVEKNADRYFKDMIFGVQMINTPTAMHFRKRVGLPKNKDIDRYMIDIYDLFPMLPQMTKQQRDAFFEDTSFVTLDEKANTSQNSINYILRFNWALSPEWRQRVFTHIMNSDRMWKIINNMSKEYTEKGYVPSYNEGEGQHSEEVPHLQRLQELRCHYPDSHMLRFVLMQGLDDPSIAFVEEDELKEWRELWDIQKSLDIYTDPFQIWKDMHTNKTTALDLAVEIAP